MFTKLIGCFFYIQKVKLCCVIGDEINWKNFLNKQQQNIYKLIDSLLIFFFKKLWNKFFNHEQIIHVHEGTWIIFFEKCN